MTDEDSDEQSMRDRQDACATNTAGEAVVMHGNRFPLHAGAKS